MSPLNLIAGSKIHNALPDMYHPIVPLKPSHNRVSSRIQSDMRSLSGIKLLSEHIISKECVASYMGARGFPADLNSQLTDSRLPQPTQAQLMRAEFPKTMLVEQEWCFLAGLPSGRFDGLLVCSGWQS